jgi:hypothetical protein
VAGQRRVEQISGSSASRCSLSRRLHAIAYESAFIFQIGGATGALAASASVEQSDF